MRTISKSKTFALRFAVKPCGGAQLSWLMLQLSPTCKKSAVGSVISARRSWLHITYTDGWQNDHVDRCEFLQQYVSVAAVYWMPLI